MAEPRLELQYVQKRQSNPIAFGRSRDTAVTTYIIKNDSSQYCVQSRFLFRDSSRFVSLRMVNGPSSTLKFRGKQFFGMRLVFFSLVCILAPTISNVFHD